MKESMDTMASKNSAANGSDRASAWMGKTPSSTPGIPDAAKVLRGAEPEVGGPDLHTELAAHEDRGHRSSAPEVQHPHTGSQVDHLGQPLGHPQRVGGAP